MQLGDSGSPRIWQRQVLDDLPAPSQAEMEGAGLGWMLVEFPWAHGRTVITTRADAWVQEEEDWICKAGPSSSTTMEPARPCATVGATSCCCYCKARPRADAQTIALLAAAKAEDIATLTDLQARGAEINAADDYGTTAVMFAALSGDAEVVEALAGRGADVNAADNNGQTAVILAAGHGHIKVVEALAGRGADPKASCRLKVSEHLPRAR